MIIEFIDRVYCKVSPKQDIRKVESCLEYPSDTWKDGPYRKSKITRTSSLCDRKDGKFFAGLYVRVAKHCENNGIAVETRRLPESLYACEKPCLAALPGIELREDQLGLLEKIDESKRGLVVAPPGIGKTVLAGAVISKHPMSKSITIVHTKSLFWQTVKNFRRWFGKRSVGVIGDDVYSPSVVNVVMVKTAHGLCKVDGRGKFTNANGEAFTDLLMEADILIIDEAHHAGEQGGMYSVVCKCCARAEIRVGFTATPNSDKRKALVCEGLLGPVIGELTIQEGIEKNLLAKPSVRLVPVPFNSAIAEKNLTYGPSYKFVDGKKTLVSNGIYVDGVILNKARNRLIAREAASIIAAGESVLVMITDVVNKHGEILQAIAKDVYGVDLFLVHGETENETREKIKDALQSKKAMGVIASSVWREGINIPSLDCVIWGAGGKADIQTLQGFGRGLRKTEKKDSFTIIDFLDPYKYLAQHAIQRLRVYVEKGCL